MNDSIITLALTRHDEMMRRAENERLVASVRGRKPRSTRKARAVRRPLLRLRLTATGR